MLTSGVPCAGEGGHRRQRLAYRRHVPVEDRPYVIGVLGSELAVVGLEVVVHEAHARRRRTGPFQLGVDLVHRGGRRDDVGGHPAVRLVGRTKSHRVFHPLTWRAVILFQHTSIHRYRL